MNNQPIDFVFPIDGDVLFSVADGTEQNGCLFTKMTATAPSDRHILINGVSATENNGIYEAQISLDAYQNRIELSDETSGFKKTITVFWFKNGYRKYRMGVDDVIWSFEDIYKKDYASIFDNPFFAMFQELYEKYSTQVQFHLYYQNADNSFNLSMFPDRYKQEFRANAHWLRLTFHAFQDAPDSPYKHASYEQAVREGRMVEKEIIRFAGIEVLSHVTAQHWGDSNIYATRGFRALGYKVLQAYFVFDENGDPQVSYYLNREQTAHAASRDFWVDTQEDIIFVKDDIVINEVALVDIESHMESVYAQEGQRSFMCLLTHEQYFYDFYFRYEPDYKERIFKTCEWVENHGYRSSFISDFALEP